MKSATQITIETIGVPRISNGNGEDLTPTGSRQRAILVILALSPRMAVGRRWLEALLWSDRSTEQASGSLRQALSLIRRQLKSASCVMHASRNDVWLQANSVKIDLIDTPAQVLEQLNAGRDFLEGIDILSEGFEDWLRQERASLHEKALQTEQLGDARIEREKDKSQQPTAPNVPILYSSTDTSLSDNAVELFLAETISGQLTKTAISHFRTDVRLLDGNLVPAIISPGARFTVRVLQLNGEYSAIARMTEEPSGRVFWLRQVQFDGSDNQSTMDMAASLATEAAEAMAAQQIVASSAQTANTMAASALSDVFSFDPERLRSAVKALGEANSLDPHAPRPALRALALAFLALETQKEDSSQLESEATELIHTSTKLDSGNALALSFIADVHDLVFEDSHTALAFAMNALKANAGIGYAYASLGALELRRGKTQEALLAATRAQKQLANSSLEVFSLMRLCVANMTMNNFGAAEKAAQRAAELAPTSQPPLRHLYALKLRRNDQEGAREVLTALRRSEPEFSMSYIRENPEFPAATLRNMQFHKLDDVEL